MKDGSRAQVNWNEKFQGLVKFEGMPTAQTPVIGDWLTKQRYRLKGYFKKSEYGQPILQNRSRRE